MATQQGFNKQLKQIGADFHLWGRNEIRELIQVLAEDELIHQCVNGHYEGGFAMLAATDRRLLLVDHKPMFLTLEAVWYDKMVQIDFYHRLLNATLCVSTPNKDVHFTSWNHGRLKKILLYAQCKMAETKEAENEHLKAHLREQGHQENASRNDLNQTSGSLTKQDEFKTNPPQAFLEEIDTPNSLLSRFQFPKVANSYDLTLYGATRLPYSRRRYYARSANLIS